jgi:hypothetical protein
MNKQRISRYCIYTIRDRKELESLAKAGGEWTLREGKPWIGGRFLLDQARLANEAMPVLLADACDCSKIIFWGFLTSIDILETRPRTFFTLDRLRRVLRSHAPQELTLKRTGKKIAPNFIKPYAICLTPQFLRADLRARVLDKESRDQN